MEYMTTAALTAVFTVVFLLIYKFVINPQMVVVPDMSKMSQCPDRWNYNPASKQCEAAYQTACLPFDPSASTLDSYTAKCNLARTCGTTWSGFCG